ncbi:MAG: GNAT family N-acetyltransferase [Deltaproteobacteria bacterium]|jgi:ribosomal protein S18 acetylase RimI-like enzyme|nr:GNAT family N-acetyltransferase [Deltaproteobacteria bacterium]
MLSDGNPAPTIRRATLADVETVVALVHGAYRGDESRAGWTTEADLLDGRRTDRDEVTELLEQPSTRILLAEIGQAVTGTVLLRNEQSAGYIGMLAVKPTSQARGIGRLLLATAEQMIAAEWQLSVARMTVIRQRADLIRWYARHGYRDTGRREPFPYGNERYGIPRRPDLEFVVLEKSLPARTHQG